MTEDEQAAHEAAMIAVAEGGDPNAPDDLDDTQLPSDTDPNATDDEYEGDIELPEGFDSVEELIKWANEQNEDEDDEDDDEEEADYDDDEDPLLQELRNRAEEAESILATQQVHDAVGGKEEYAKTLTWAGQNLNEGETQFYDSIMENGSPAEAAFAARALHAMAVQASIEANGHVGSVTMPDGTGSSEGAGYDSQAEMQRDMADPRYQNDSAFQQKVVNKLMATTAF